MSQHLEDEAGGWTGGQADGVLTELADWQADGEQVRDKEVT